MGMFVVSCGVLVVVSQFFLGLSDRRKAKSLTQLIVAALAHEPHNEFCGRAGDKDEVERTRFRIHDTDGLPGELKFEAALQ